MQLIWAPWRYTYFDLPKRKKKGCFVCRALRARAARDRANLVLVREQLGIIMLNRYPYTVGSLMIVPLDHRATLKDVDDETKLCLMHLVVRGEKILDEACHPKGYNIGINQGIAAGAGLNDHLHIHVVPRWDADTNLMTTIGGARVLSEALDHMYDRLQRVIKKQRQ